MPLLHLLLAGLALGETRMVAFGREVTTLDPGTMLEAITERYAAAHGLMPTAEELAPLRKLFGEPNRVVDFPYRIGLSHKLNLVWWGRHGGRLALSAFGLHLAVDGMLREVEEMERAGDVKFVDEEARKKFFGFYREYRGDGVVTGVAAEKALKEISAKLGSRSDGKNR